MKHSGFPLIILLILVGTSFTKGQDIEAGLFLGTAQYQGDLTEKQITIGETKPAFGGIFRYYFNPRFNFKANVYYGWISGSDKNYQDESQFRKKRNLSFRSHVLEGSVQLEFNILPYVNNSRLYNWAPYVFGGISVFNFNPKTDHKGETVELQPLGTEGQGTQGNPDKYSLTQLSIPFGVGIKYSVGSGWNIGFEAGMRKTFTDYLDDVSTDYADPSNLSEQAADVADRSEELEQYNTQQFSGGDGRGNPENDDWYIFTGFTITKTFRENRCMGFY